MFPLKVWMIITIGGRRGTRRRLNAGDGGHDSSVEEFELADDCDGRGNSHLPLTGNPEFQQSATNEGRHLLKCYSA